MFHSFQNFIRNCQRFPKWKPYVPEVGLIEFDYFTHLLVLLSLVVSHCVFNSPFPSNYVSIFAYLGRLCFSRFLYSVGSKIFEMSAAFQVKIATQIS